MRRRAAHGRLLLRFARTMAVSLTTVYAGVFVLSACSSKSNLVNAGGECFLATDCAPGLVCVEQANKSRVCSDDLTRVAGRGPPEGGVAEAGEAGEAGEGGQPDAPPPQDTGQDTKPPPQDTGPPPVDSATD